MWSLWSQQAAQMEARIAQYQAEHPMQLVDLVQPANKIAPEHATLMGVEQNATHEETVAIPHPAQTPAVHHESRTTHHASRVTSNEQPITNHEPRITNHESPTTMHEPAKPSAQRAPPSTALVERMDGSGVLSVPEDYFPDFHRGGHTYVNVMRHPGVEYFVELKRALKIAWNPIPPLRANYALIRDRGSVAVVIGVTVDASGNLVERFVLKSSGIGAYDQEALRAFSATFPFFAPPEKILSMDGEVDRVLRMSWVFEVFF